MKIWYIFLFITYSITPMSSSSSDSERDIEAQKQLTTITRRHSDRSFLHTKSVKDKYLGPSLNKSSSSPELTELTQVKNIACAIVLGSAQETPTAQIFKNKIEKMHTNGDPRIAEIQQLSSDDDSDKRQLQQEVEKIFGQALLEYQQSQKKKVRDAKIWSVATVGLAVIPIILVLLQSFVIIGVGVGCNT